MSPYLLQLARGICGRETWGIDMNRMILIEEKYPTRNLPGNKLRAQRDYIDSITKYDYLNY